MVNCSSRWRLRRLRSRHSAVADEEPTLPRRLDELIDLKMEAQNTHKEGKRNFDKKKWRETQYSHKQRGIELLVCSLPSLFSLRKNWVGTAMCNTCFDQPLFANFSIGMGKQKKRSCKKKIQEDAKKGWIYFICSHYKSFVQHCWWKLQ